MSDASMSRCPRCDRLDYDCQCEPTDEEQLENLGNWYRAYPRTVVEIQGKWWALVEVVDVFETNAEAWAEFDRQEGRSK